jgi:hypothetical protein
VDFYNFSILGLRVIVFIITQVTIISLMRRLVKHDFIYFTPFLLAELKIKHSVVFLCNRVCLAKHNLLSNIRNETAKTYLTEI